MNLQTIFPVYRRHRRAEDRREVTVLAEVVGSVCEICCEGVSWLKLLEDSTFCVFRVTKA